MKGIHANGTMNILMGVGEFTATTAITGLRFSVATGNVESGKMFLHRKAYS